MSGPKIMLRFHPIWLSVIVISGAGGAAIFVVALFNADDSGLTIVLSGLGLSVALVGAGVVADWGVHPIRAKQLVELHRGSDAWIGSPATTLRGIFAASDPKREHGPYRSKVIVLMDSQALSVWQMSRGWLTQRISVARGSVAGVRVTDVPIFGASDKGVAISVVDQSGTAVDLEILPTVLKVAGSSFSNIENAEAGRQLVQHWLDERQDK
jgi:hypothetical protein